MKSKLRRCPNRACSHRRGYYREHRSTALIEMHIYCSEACRQIVAWRKRRSIEGGSRGGSTRQRTRTLPGRHLSAKEIATLYESKEGSPTI